MLVKPAQRPPNGALRKVCASNPSPQNSSIFLQHSPQAALLRVRPTSAASRCTLVAVRRASVSHWIASAVVGAFLPSVASLALLSWQFPLPLLFLLPPLPAVGDWAPPVSLASQENAQCPRWLHCRHCARRSGFECLHFMSASGVYTHLDFPTDANVFAAQPSPHDLSAMSPVSSLSPLATAAKVSGVSGVSALPPLSAMSALSALSTLPLPSI